MHCFYWLLFSRSSTWSKTTKISFEFTLIRFRNHARNEELSDVKIFVDLPHSIIYVISQTVWLCIETFVPQTFGIIDYTHPENSPFVSYRGITTSSGDRNNHRVITLITGRHCNLYAFQSVENFQLVFNQNFSYDDRVTFTFLAHVKDVNKHDTKYSVVMKVSSCISTPHDCCMVSYPIINFCCFARIISYSRP